MEVEKDDHEFERIVDNYFKDGILFFKVRYVGETLGEYNITEVRFEDLNKDAPVEISRYTRNHVIEVSKRKGPFDAWAVKVLKVHTRANMRLYNIRYIDRGYSM